MVRESNRPMYLRLVHDPYVSKTHQLQFRRQAVPCMLTSLEATREANRIAGAGR
jgi:hypothetical protein